MKEEDEVQDLFTHLMEHISDHNFNYFKLTLEAEKHMVRFKQIRNIGNKAASKRAKNARRLTFKHKEITRKLKDLAPAPMTCLRRNRTTGAHRIKGTLTTDFEEIDNILHDVMGGITDGNSKDLQKTVNDFQEQYRQYMHKSKPGQVDDITSRSLRSSALKGVTRPQGFMDGLIRTWPSSLIQPSGWWWIF